MIADSFFFQISIILNTLLAFFTATFVVEGILRLFRISGHRTRAMLRILPFFYLILDRIFNHVSLINWLNPLSCDSCIQKFLLLFSPSLNEYLRENNITLMRYLDSGYPLFSKILLASFFLITFTLVLHQFLQIVFQMRFLRAIIQKSSICRRPICNARLASALSKSNITIVQNNDIQIPMATSFNKIVIPTKIMETVSQDEFEAIIAHELAHINWKDPLSRLFIQFVSVVFWWIPTQWWINKLMQDQEMACDESVLAYQLNSEYLVSALVKVAKQAKDSRYEMLCAFANKTNSTLLRLQVMAGESTSKKAIGFGCIGLSLEMLILGLCMFWMR